MSSQSQSLAEKKTGHKISKGGHIPLVTSTVGFQKRGGVTEATGKPELCRMLTENYKGCLMQKVYPVDRKRLDCGDVCAAHASAWLPNYLRVLRSAKEVGPADNPSSSAQVAEMYIHVETS